MAHKNSRGFTIIEALIATTIMVSVVGALAYGLGQCSNINRSVHHQDIALNAAQQKLEEIANDISNIESYGIAPDNAFDVDGLPDPTGSTDEGAIVVNEVVANELYDVAVTVTWEERGLPVSRTLSTSFHM